MTHSSTTETALPALARFKMYTKSICWARLMLQMPVQGNLRDQMHRAVHSVVLNTAEGGAQASEASKRKHFRIARASLWEVAAALDLLVIESGAGRVDAQCLGLIRELDAMLGALLRRR